MTVTTLDLFQILQSKLGQNEAKALVEFVESEVQLNLKQEMNSFATGNDIRNLRGDMHTAIHNLDIKIEKMRADLIKWMFVFWMGQISVTVALVMLVLK
ncbi:MAG: hypothetical protein WCI48_16065 [Bacteroidota bacterium]